MLVALFTCGLATVAHTSPDVCYMAREAACDLCGEDSLVCEHCNDEMHMFCDASPRSEDDALHCSVVLEDVSSVDPDPAIRAELCEQAEENLLLTHRVPRACETADREACGRCGVLTCLFADAADVAATFGTGCELLVVALRRPETLGLELGEVCRLFEESR